MRTPDRDVQTFVADVPDIDGGVSASRRGTGGTGAGRRDRSGGDAGIDAGSSDTGADTTGIGAGIRSSGAGVEGLDRNGSAGASDSCKGGGGCNGPAAGVARRSGGLLGDRGPGAAAGEAGAQIVVNLPGSRHAAAGGLAHALVIGEIGHQDFIAEDGHRVFHMLGERHEVREETHEARAQQTILADFGGVDETRLEFRVGEHVGLNLLVEANGLLTEFRELLALLRSQADQKRQLAAGCGHECAQLGDVLVDQFGGNAVVVGHGGFLFRTVADVFHTPCKDGRSAGCGRGLRGATDGGWSGASLVSACRAASAGGRSGMTILSWIAARAVGWGDGADAAMTTGSLGVGGGILHIADDEPRAGTVVPPTRRDSASGGFLCPFILCRLDGNAEGGLRRTARMMSIDVQH